MHCPSPRRLLLAACSALAALSSSYPLAHAAKDNRDIAAIYTRAASDYTRTLLPDGSFKPETYALGNGGHLSASVPALDGDNFRVVAGALAGPLSRRRYVSSADPAKTDLLIMVHLGTTNGTSVFTANSTGYQALQSALSLNPPSLGDSTGALHSLSRSGPTPGTLSDPSGGDSNYGITQTIGALNQISMFNALQSMADASNARLLGFNVELNKYDSHEFSALRHRLHDVLDELRDNRYYAILVAYDFRLLWKEKKLRPRWIARISLPTQGNDFVRQLPSMFDQASRFLGENSPGLIRQALPEVDIQYGDLRVIDQDTPVKK